MGKKIGEHVKIKIGGTQHEYQLAGIVRYVDTQEEAESGTSRARWHFRQDH